MYRTRRRFLQLGAGVVSAGLAGCSSLTGGSVGYPGASGGGSSGGTQTTRPSTTTSRETSQPAQETTQPPLESVPNVPFGEATDHVFSEIEWFAQRYADAISSYQTRAERVRRTASQVYRSTDLTTADVKRVVDEVRRFEEFATTAVFPHFYVRPATRVNVTAYADRFQTFATRGDIDRAKVELARLRTFYDRVGSDTFVAEWLSDDPIEDFVYHEVDQPVTTLLDYLRGGSTDPLLYVVDYPATNYAAYVFPEPVKGDTNTDAPSRRLVNNPDSVPVTDARARYEDVFQAVSVAERRTGRAYVTSFWVPESGAVYPSELPYQPIYLQRYDTPRSAYAALQTMTDGPVSEDEGMPGRLGDRKWRSVYYYYRNDVVYAYLLQAGRYLVAMAPATTPWDERGTWIGPPWDEYPEAYNPLYNRSTDPMVPWDERPDWDEPLKRSWVW